MFEQKLAGTKDRREASPLAVRLVNTKWGQASHLAILNERSRFTFLDSFNESGVTKNCRIGGRTPTSPYLSS